LEYVKVKAKSLLNRLKRRDDWYKCAYTLNPYRGCQFACPYCYDVAQQWRGQYHAKPSEVAWKIFVKENAVERLREELKRKPRDIVAIGSATDPYQPAEARYEITRKCLEVLVRAEWPVEVGTKSPLILRDLDLLEEASKRSFCCIFITVTTLDEKLTGVFEPAAPKPSERLKVVEQLSEAGIEVCVTMIPVFPYLTDSFKDVLEVASKAEECGAKYFMAGGLTLPGEVRYRFYRLLEARFPELLPKYEKLYGTSGYPSHQYEVRIRRMAEAACGRLGLSKDLKPGFSRKNLQSFF